MSRMLKFCLRIRYSSRSSGPSKASRKISSASGGMYRSCGMANSGSPYRRASATWSTTVGMPVTSSAGGCGRTVSLVLSMAQAASAALARVVAVHVRLLRDAGFLPFGVGLAVQVLVPPDRAAGALLRLQVRLLGLELLDELGDVRPVVGTPEDALEEAGHGLFYVLAPS